MTPAYVPGMGHVMPCEWGDQCRTAASDFFREEIGGHVFVHILCSRHSKEMLAARRMAAEGICSMGGDPNNLSRRVEKLFREMTPKRVSAGEAVVISVMTT